MSAARSQPIRILIADDHELARAGLRTFFVGEAQFAIVAEACNGHEAVACCADHQPDVALLDVRMGDMDGLTACKRIITCHPTIRVIIVTMHEDPAYLIEALKAGAIGYLLKETPRREFQSAIRAAMRGEICIHPGLMTVALRQMAVNGSEQRAGQPENLTARETEVLRLLVQGQTNRQISSALAISPGTVKTHVERIIAKLGVVDRTQAAVRAVEQHLV